jgi:hypothetical protein
MHSIFVLRNGREKLLVGEFGSQAKRKKPKPLMDANEHEFRKNY